MSFFITVDLPDPLGPHSTSGLGGAGGGFDLELMVLTAQTQLYKS